MSSSTIETSLPSLARSRLRLRRELTRLALHLNNSTCQETWIVDRILYAIACGEEMLLSQDEAAITALTSLLASYEISVFQARPSFH